MNKERFERNWRVSVDSLDWRPAVSDQYRAIIPDTFVAVLGPYEVWNCSGSYSVTLNRVTCTRIRDLSVYA